MTISLAMSPCHLVILSRIGVYMFQQRACVRRRRLLGEAGGIIDIVFDARTQVVLDRVVEYVVLAQVVAEARDRVVGAQALDRVGPSPPRARATAVRVAA